jgi:hypothetical protein
MKGVSDNTLELLKDREMQDKVTRTCHPSHSLLA